MESPGKILADFVGEAFVLPERYGLKPFQHTPLPSATTHIRLLRLQPGSGAIRCVTEDVQLSTPTLEFTALSYRWGPKPLISRTIVLNERRQSVQRNLFTALVALRKH